MASTMTDPRELMLHELRDLYYAEKTITKALPDLIDEASDKELVAGFEKHLEETKQHVSNLERVFEQLGEKAEGERCPGIEGLKEEHDLFMKEESPTGAVKDMFLTGAAARVEHYEIAAYDGLLTLARGLGESECTSLLEENLRSEKAALQGVASIGERLARTAAPAGASA